MDNDIPKAPCLVCGGEAHRLLLCSGDDQLFQCLSCSFVSQDPSKKDASPSFQHYYDIFNDINLWTKSREKLFHHFLNEIERRTPGRRLLDVGAGMGYLVSLAKRRGWEAIGIDLSEKACRLAQELYGVTVFQETLATFPQEQDLFDALVFLDSLYYSSDPGGQLKHAAGLLRKGGIVALRVTNVQFHLWAFRLLQGFGPLLRLIGMKKLFVFHLCLFSPKTIGILLERCGYGEIKVSNSPLTTGDPYGLMKGMGVMGQGLKSFAFFIITLIAWVSWGKVLMAPSLEVYARKLGHV